MSTSQPVLTILSDSLTATQQAVAVKKLRIGDDTDLERVLGVSMVSMVNHLELRRSVLSANNQGGGVLG